MIDKVLRFLPAFPGKQRLARLIFKKKIEEANDISILGDYNCTYVLPNIKENIGFEIFINGIYEKETVDFIIKYMPANKMLLDIGANIGAISIPVCKERKDIYAICVEAAPWIFEYLKVNTKANEIQNFKLINKAISNESGNQVMFYSPRQLFGKGSLSPVFTQNGIKVQTISMVDLVKEYAISDIGLVKIDVEGFEYLAFAGGDTLLGDVNAPDILFEFVDWAENSSLLVSPGAAQNLLKQFGYHIFLFDKGIVKHEVETSITTGCCMFFATKKKNFLLNNYDF